MIQLDDCGQLLRCQIGPNAGEIETSALTPLVELKPVAEANTF